MQSLAAQRRLRVSTVKGAENVADLDTKYLDRAKLLRLREMVGVQPAIAIKSDYVSSIIEDQTPPTQPLTATNNCSHLGPTRHNALCRQHIVAASAHQQSKTHYLQRLPPCHYLLPPLAMGSILFGTQPIPKVLVDGTAADFVEYDNYVKMALYARHVHTFLTMRVTWMHQRTRVYPLKDNKYRGTTIPN